jgi:ornithine carbamoyltransferase
VKDLLRIADLSADDLSHLLFLADGVRSGDHRRGEVLKDDTVVLHFAEPSTRTRLSFAVAVGRLGGRAHVTGPADLQLGRGETMEDAARVISRFARAFVIRTFADEDVRRFAAAATIPVVNARTGVHHPCQALADLATLRRRFGRVAGLRLAYVGAAGNVAHSLLEAGALAGADVVVAAPPGEEPDGDVLATARDLAGPSGPRIEVTDDPLAAVRGADAVSTGVPVPKGGDEAQERAREELLRPYQVTDELMAAAAPHAVFMQCLPAHRGHEVAASVIDGPRSVVVDQAEALLHTAQAVLFALVLDQLHGTGRPRTASGP